MISELSYKIYFSIIHILYSKIFGSRESPVSWALVPSYDSAGPGGWPTRNFKPTLHRMSGLSLE